MGWTYSRDAPDTLLEVFSVRMYSDEIDDISAAEFDGEVRVTDIATDINLYNPKEGEKPVLPDGTLRLTGPFRCIVAPYACVHLNLVEKSRNLEVCNGEFELSPYVNVVPYDERLSTLVSGKHGFAIINFMLYSCAVQAIVEVSLVTTDHVHGNDLISCPASLYGYIHASNDLRSYNCAYDLKFFQSVLFNVSKENPKEPNTSDGSKIVPLSRSIVAVPIKSQLIIKAQLFDAGTEANIADDTASFMAATSGSESRIIGGIMVKVDWLIDPFGTPGTIRPCTGGKSTSRRKRLSEAMSK
ncbi:hypothetical protein SOVF_130300 [Spinacia oleracea]|uniref:DUF6598 domain-containing protein n=1 Tax=Spinacia oleracea TaxID=3562 RepID=A0A9R0K1Q4_SPIOL|nr:uncharacterized protein LOC110793765 [Spinacia oleracea]KNA11957.1 hypothetical protein SOVF_130300 [Spinacia oleracea]